ncbi:hypothetical protein Nstercoris_02164 [Nitrosomonas stercoris]|uniref:Uncharacterized protein n=1 Tax=Nitrosomonas stercoris TaxID=1444684 RepID=A0A4Y1YS20_9PROT|nr:hypothetical protein Nstercoris_02164 [Nitrosomonas stercoris]
MNELLTILRENPEPLSRLDVSNFYHERINHSALFAKGKKTHQRH